jgi:WD40 repeat protein
VDWINRNKEPSADDPADVVLDVPNTRANDHIIGVALAPDGRFATGTRGGTVTLRTATGEPLLTWPAHAEPVSALAFAPDSSALVSVGRDGGLRVWSLALGEPVLRAEARDPGPVTAAAVAPDGRLLALGSVGQVRVWRLEPNRLAPTAEFASDEFAAPGTCVTALAFSANGRALAAGGCGAGRAWVWQLGGPADPQRIDVSSEFQIRGLRFTDDGSALVAVDSDRNVIRADAAGARVVNRLPGGSLGEEVPSAKRKGFGGDRCVRQAAFSPDGRRVIIAYTNGTARLTSARDYGGAHARTHL